jgi:hypothetical protein
MREEREEGKREMLGMNDGEREREKQPERET